MVKVKSSVEELDLIRESIRGLCAKFPEEYWSRTR